MRQNSVDRYFPEIYAKKNARTRAPKKETNLPGNFPENPQKGGTQTAQNNVLQKFEKTPPLTKNNIEYPQLRAREIRFTTTGPQSKAKIVELKNPWILSIVGQTELKTQ